MERDEVFVGGRGAGAWRDEPARGERDDQPETGKDRDLPQAKPQDVLEREVHDDAVEQRDDESGRDAHGGGKEDDLV